MENIPQTFNDKPLIYAWTYRDQEGEALGMVGRYQNGAGKDVVPFFKRNGSQERTWCLSSSVTVQGGRPVHWMNPAHCTGWTY
jgi:hypothetical protein